MVDMGEEMTNLVIANRSYQANLTVMDRARDAYLKALEIGRK
jgi:flagellar basal-body rod protein FlgC